MPLVSEGSPSIVLTGQVSAIRMSSSLIKMKLDSGCTCLLSQATEPTHEPSGSPCADMVHT